MCREAAKAAATYARLKAFSLTNKFRERKGAGLSNSNTARNDAKSMANQGWRNRRLSA